MKKLTSIITIIGASGAIGMQITRMFLDEKYVIKKLNLVVHSKEGLTKVQSLVEDSLPYLLDKKILVTDNCEMIEETDIVIFCAGHAVSQELTAIKDNNRQLLFERNLKIVESYVSILNKKCSGGIFVLVTNPVSKLLASLYGKLNMQLIGVGVTNDTLRFRNALCYKYGLTYNNIKDLVSTAFVVGEHSSYNKLTYVGSTLNSKIRKELEKDKKNNEFPVHKIKKIQEDKLNNIYNGEGTIIELFDEMKRLPALEAAYFTHRTIHYTIKTYFSTCIAVREIIDMYCNSLHKVLPAEVICNMMAGHRKTVIGLPVTFRNKKIIIKNLSYSQYEKKVLEEAALENIILNNN